MSEPVDGLRGFDHEVVEEVFRRKGLAAEIIYVPWTRAMSDTKNGLSPVLLSCARSEERAEYFHFSEPISRDTYGLYFRRGFELPEISGLSDIIGQRVASVHGYVSLAKLHEIGADPIEVPSETTGFKMLALSRIDFLFSGKEATDFFLKQSGMSGEFDFHEIEYLEYHLCLSKKHPEAGALLQPFNDGLAEVKADGTYQLIHARYR
ncbi:transporter substrate-binding domain-containing protein [Roseibium sp. CAU 1639]|uniref:Transporter substrate-binding domain-containing protein n=2 Tax=Roseibium sediminicola TaxID=2933272 RepID=A0ABT0H1R1_9HYPH|nr:transporter substrate-binding domain-containing protein [Roseibium sp. CAU 1639]